jgi:3',5'-nucleoside bisphosphate phosphatase
VYKPYDLHIHTTASDGALTPSEVINLASQLGLGGIAITDHDTIAGLEEGMQAAKDAGMHLIPGVEFSAESENEMHILGYRIGNSGAIKKVFKNLNQARSERNPQIVERLRQMGMDIAKQEVESEAGGSVIGRPHIARVLLKKGYVKDVGEAFDKYLSIGKAAYVYKRKISAHRAIELIGQENGYAVLAHPKYLYLADFELEQLLASLKDEGLWGIEAFYPAHSPEDTDLYLRLAKKFSLQITCGTDYHDSTRNKVAPGYGWKDCPELKKTLEVLLNSD